MQQNATETTEGRLCRHDKIVLSILIANFLIMLFWSFSVQLRASSAENTEKEEMAYSQTMQTEKMKKEYSVILKELTYSTAETTTSIVSSQTTTTSETTTSEAETTTTTSSETTVQEPTITTAIVEQTQPTETIIVTEETDPVTEEISVSNEVVSEETQADTASEESENKEEKQEEKTAYTGPVLTPRAGVVQGPSGKETYYNLKMDGVICIMNSIGYNYEYWVREDGCKMFGPYIMCAANLDIRPRGTIVETSLGQAIVCDTGGFARNNMYQLDIAVIW